MVQGRDFLLEGLVSHHFVLLNLLLNHPHLLPMRFLPGHSCTGQFIHFRSNNGLDFQEGVSVAIIEFPKGVIPFGLHLVHPQLVLFPIVLNILVQLSEVTLELIEITQFIDKRW